MAHPRQSEPAAPGTSRWIDAVRLLALISLPILIFGALGAFATQHNDVLDWMPSHSSETQRLMWFVERFGSDEILVISWDECFLDDPRLDAVASGLLRPAVNPRTQQSTQWFHQVFTGRRTLEALTDGPLALSRAEAVDRLRGWLVGKDGRTTCAMALVTAAGAADRGGAVGYVRDVATAAGVAAADLRVGGPTADAVAVDQASTQWIIPLALLSAAVGVVIAWCFLRDMRLVWGLLLAATFAWGAVLSLVYYLGFHLDAVLLVMPGLVFVLAVSGGVHLTNYYLDSGLRDRPERALSWAVLQGRLPCVLALLTTALGVGALTASEFTPVRKFGYFSAIGMLLIGFALLVLWPGWLRWLQFGGHRPPDPPGLWREFWWRPLLATASRHTTLWTLLLAVAMPLAGWGITKLRTTAQLEDLLRANSSAIIERRWLEQNIGALVPLEVILRFPRVGDESQEATTMFQRAALVEGLRRRLHELEGIDAALSATTFMPSLDLPPAGARRVMRKRVLSTHLRKHRASLVELGFLRDDDQEELWRISTRVSSLHVEYGRFLQRTGATVRGFLDRTSNGSPIAVEVCGGVPLIYLAQELLLTDLIYSFLAAFVLIAVVMIVLLGGLAAGLLAMLPNMFPAVMAFGVMGYVGVRVDIGMMMTASAALGIAVDDTLHFLVWFRRGMARYRSRLAAVKFAFRRCATPMLETTLICGLGMSVYLLSPFGPTARFGLMMAVLLALALIGDLLFLPALVCSRWGNVFKPRKEGPRAVDAGGDGRAP